MAALRRLSWLDDRKPSIVSIAPDVKSANESSRASTSAPSRPPAGWSRSWGSSIACRRPPEACGQAGARESHNGHWPATRARFPWRKIEANARIRCSRLRAGRLRRMIAVVPLPPFCRACCLVVLAPPRPGTGENNRKRGGGVADPGTLARKCRWIKGLGVRGVVRFGTPPGPGRCPSPSGAGRRRRPASSPRRRPG